ncbi:Glycosyltransferase involved in cell wall bisynthesis [Tenacibaculum sp. MAR_2009_124]|uniref:GT4 family glycosyltransferase PelF n=1 Tax=Tenacibaculum sp. MAR_2009_124 TaxID=1250059 RepID=UPI00089A3E73|nr:GT4 family glycosyltransferase PelF [Tenacibaculum sp. MAR_2009_124]SEB66074.1 Glycosyltransferase involved in cell wall bisynthesis [Tenacibaculum sp. MAR_2009_124]
MNLKKIRESVVNKRVLLITEGTYPYNYGGVSSWSHTLCNLTKKVDYVIYALNAHYEEKPKYSIHDNVKEIIQVPLWTSYDLCDIMNYGNSYKHTVSKKKATNSISIQYYFLDPFKIFVSNLVGNNRNLDKLEQSIYDLWEYFQKYDYNTTTKHPLVWREFKNIIEQSTDTPSDLVISDVAFSLQYINKLLLTLSVPIPKVDIVHITLAGLPILPALIAKKQYKSSIMVTEHGVFIRENMINISSSSLSFFVKNLIIKSSESICRLAYTRADLVTSVSKFNTKWEFRYGLDEERSKVIYNGVDENRFNIGEKPDHLKSTPTVVAIARIFALKDIITMIKTCEYVTRKIPNVKFIVYGDKKADLEYVKECEDLIHKLNLKNNFILAGHHSQPNKAFLEGDISILTSISEGFPYTVIESMSCGVPVVGTDVGGVAEAITEKTGFVCNPKDHDTLGERVIYLLRNPDIRKHMGIEARKRVLENFTLNKIIQSYEETYEDLTTKRISTKKLTPFY